MWVNILLALLSIAGSVLSVIQQRQLIEAGEAKKIAGNLSASIDTLNRLSKARSDANAKFDANDGVPDESDPNLRD